MIDTHAHLNHSDFADDIPGALARAAQAGVKALIVVGYDLDSNHEALFLADVYPAVYATIGLHPHCAAQLDDAMLTDLRRMAGEKKVVAIGETGLDYFRNLSPVEDQRRTFRALIALAAELELPLIVHNRDAHEDTLELLAENGHDQPIVMHCFGGDDAFAQECRERDYYIGLGGTLTYPRNEELRTIAAAYPGKRLLLETDAPWLPPESHRRSRNEPAYIAEVAALLAEVRGEAVETIDAQTTQNARRVFGLEAEG
jgi:TatD DNase family protein